MTDSARPMSGGIVHVDMGDEPGIGKGAMRLLVFAIAGAIVMPWVAYRSLNRYDMLRMPVTAAAAGAAVSPANVVGDAAEAVKETATVALGAVSKVNLPDGTELTVPPRGLESQIINFLTDTSGTSANEASFDCDRVIFDAGTANFQATSTDQLRNAAKILKAYPTTSVQIDGYWLVESVAAFLLVHTLDMTSVGYLVSEDFPPTVIMEEGVVTAPARFYASKLVCGVRPDVRTTRRRHLRHPTARGDAEPSRARHPRMGGGERNPARDRGRRPAGRPGVQGRGPGRGHGEPSRCSAAREVPFRSG